MDRCRPVAQRIRSLLSETRRTSAPAGRPALNLQPCCRQPICRQQSARQAGPVAGYCCRVDLVQLMPRLYFIRLPVGHAYLWHDPDGLTLIDTGLPGSAPLIADAICRSGYQPADLRRLVLTHLHADHIGAAAAIAEWGEVEVLAHHADAPFIRAAAAGPPPDLADWEQSIYENVMSRLHRKR